jgi:hypothetical protein
MVGLNSFSRQCFLFTALSVDIVLFSQYGREIVVRDRWRNGMKTKTCVEVSEWF